MGEFTYLPYTIVLVCLEYFAIIKATVWWTKRRDDAAAAEASSLRSASSVSHRQKAEYSLLEQKRWLGIFDQRCFLSCCRGLYGYNSSVLLLCTRLTSCLFFVVIGMGFNFARSEIQGHWQFFTNWNVGLIAGYYTLASGASVHYLLHLAPRDPAASSSFASTASSVARERWLELDTPRLRAVGTFLSVYFCVASVTALFVTTVNFALLDPTPRFFNMTAHLFTSVSFGVEMALNSVQLRRNELVLNMSWVMLWLAFIWPVVWLGVKPEWPYDFLDSSTPVILLWFQLLFFVYFLIYLGWHWLATRKLDKFAPSSSSFPSSFWSAGAGGGAASHDLHDNDSYESLIRTSEI